MHLSKKSSFLISIIIVAAFLIAGALAWQHLSLVGKTNTSPDNSSPTHLSKSEIEQLLSRNEPINAHTLAGHPGLYYLDAANLTGVISPHNFSAYQDLIEEGHINDDEKLATMQGLDLLMQQYQQQEPETIIRHVEVQAKTSIEAGLGLSGGGKGDVSLHVVPGEGIIIRNDKITAVLGEDVDLLTEVAGILPILRGGTGLAISPEDGQFLVGDGTGYQFARFQAGDGITLTRANGIFTYAIDNTVCRISGNCLGVGGGLNGFGSAGHIAYFTDEDTIQSHPALTWNAGSQQLSLNGDLNISGEYHVNGQPLNTDLIPEGLSHFYYSTARFQSDFDNQTTDDLPEGVSALYWTDARFDSRLSTKTTTNLTEGSNLYYTDSRVSSNPDVAANTAARHQAATVTDSSTLDLSIVGQQITGTVIQNGIQTSLINNDAGFIANLTAFTTDDLGEGSSNLYWSQALFDAALAGTSTSDINEGDNLYWTQVRFDTAFGDKTTSELSEGANLYYTQARFDVAFGEKDTDDLSEGIVNLYYTSDRFETDFSGQTTDDLAEGLVNQYYSDALFSTSLALRTSDDLTEGVTNLYFSQARFNTAFANKTTDDLAEGSGALYWTDARFDSKLSTITTDDIAEGANNLYYTDERVANHPSVIAAGDSGHAAVTVVDSATLDLTIVGQQLSGTVIQGGLQTSLINNDAGFISNLTAFTTDDLAEGETHRYWSQSLFDAALANASTTDLAEGENLYWTAVRFDAAFSAKDTGDLTEGVNLYYTPARFDAAFASKSTDNLAEGLVNLYYTADRFEADFSGQTTDDLAEGLVNRYYSDALFSTSLALRTSDDIAEGSTNLFYTTNRFQTDFENQTTDDLAEGSTALYWTDSRFDSRLTSKTTDDLAEGSANLYYTDARVANHPSVVALGESSHPAATVIDTSTLDLSIVGQQISGTVIQNGIQTSLINNDAGFVSNLTAFTTDDLAEGSSNRYWSQALFNAAFSGKTTTDLSEGSNLYWTQIRFDSAFGDKTTTNLAEGSNLYWTQARFDAAFSAMDSDDLAEGAVNLYYTTDRFEVDFGNQTTDDLTEGETNRYYSDALFGNSLALRTTDNLSQGATNLYYSTSLFESDFGAQTTDDLTEGLSNFYSQWSPSLNGITFGQSVGIGADTDPTATLDLTGTLKVSGAVTLSSMTTNGGILYTTGSGVVAQLGSGSVNQCLKATGGVPTWGSCAAGDSITGTGSPGQLAFFDTSSTLSGESALIWNTATDTLTIDGDVDIAGDIIPALDNVYSLGSPTMAWRDVYIGPGSLYVNGQKVLQEESSSIIVSADPSQNLALRVSDGGDVELSATGGGLVQLKGNVQLTGGYTFSTSDNTAVVMPDGLRGGNIQLAGNTISTTNTNGDIAFIPNGGGDSYFSSGNLGVGNSNPFFTLDVTGQINSTAGYLVNGSPLSTSNIAEGSGLYWTNARFDARLSTKTTDDLAEGDTNLYYTDERVANHPDVIAAGQSGHAPVTVTDSSTLDLTIVGQQLTGSVIQSGLSISLMNNDAGFITNLTGFTTDDLAEGEANLYWTQNRFDTAFGNKNTGDLAEGSNLYYTQARFNSAFSSRTTDQLVQGSVNLYSQWLNRANGIAFGQRVGIGATTNPTVALDVAGAIRATGAITFSSFSTNGGIIYTNGSGLLSQTTAGSAGQCLISSGGGAPTWAACDSASMVSQGGNSFGTTMTIGTNDAHALTLETSGVDRLTISALGTITANGALTASSLFTANDAGFSPLLVHRAATTTNVTIGFQNNAGGPYYFGADITGGYFGFVSSAVNLSGSALKLYVDSGNISTAGTISGNGSGLTSLNASNLSTGTVSNSRLTNSGALTVTAGSGLTGGGSVALGGSTTINIGSDAVTDAHLAFNTGQHLTTASAPTFAGLTISGRTLQQSNLEPQYQWAWGGQTDLNWKTIANVSVGTSLYAGVAFRVEVTDSDGNHGNSADIRRMEYFVSMLRSSGTLDNQDTATVSGPNSEFVRVVKTTTGQYELQVRQSTNYRHMQVRAQAVSILGATVSYVDSPANGSTTGDIYTPTAIHTDRFARGQFSGQLTALNGFTLSSGALSLPNNSITDAMVSNTLTASIFIGSGSISNAVDLGTDEVAGTLANTHLVNSGALTVTAGSGLIGGGSVALGGSTTLNIGTDAITDTHLQYNTGQHLTSTSAPTFGGLTVSGGNGAVDMLIVADADNLGTESDHPTLTFSQDGGQVQARLGYFDGGNSFSIYNAFADELGLGTNNRKNDILISASGALTFSNYSTNGGILYTNGSGLVGQLTAGSTGQCLISSGSGAPAWGACSPSDSVTGTGVAGRISFWSGANTQSSDSSFVWDSTNDRLGIGAGVPQDTIDIQGNGAGITIRSSTQNIADAANIRLLENATAGIRLQYDGVGPGSSNGALVIKDNNTDATIATFARDGNVTINGTITGNGSGLTSLNASNLSSGTVSNARLTNSGALTVTAGSGLTGGGSVALGGTVTINIGSDSITDAHLAFNTGQHLTTSSSPTFAGLTVDEVASLDGYKTYTVNNSTSWSGSAPELFTPLGRFSTNDPIRVIASDNGCGITGGVEYQVVPSYSGEPTDIKIYSMGDTDEFPDSEGHFVFYTQKINVHEIYLAVAHVGGCADSSKQVIYTVMARDANKNDTDAVKANYTELAATQYVYNGFNRALTLNNALTVGGSLTVANGLTVSAGTLSLPNNAITDAMVSNTLTSSIFIGSGSTSNSVDLGTAEVAGTLPNARLVNSGALTVTAGNGLTGGGSTALGGSTSLAVGAGSGITVGSTTVSITTDGVTDSHLQYNTGQHLTTTSSPTFGGLTVNGGTQFNTMAGYQTAGTITINRADGVNRPFIIETYNSNSPTSNYMTFKIHNGTEGQTTDALTLLGNGNVVIGGTLSGDGSGLTSLNASNIATGTINNARLVNSGALTVTAGSGLSGGGSVALGGSTTINIGSNTVTNAHLQFDTGQHLTSSSSPTFTGLTVSGLTTNGGVLYTNGSGVLAQTGTGSNGQCLVSNGGGAPSWGACGDALPANNVTGSGASGRISFWNGTYTQASDSIFVWDATNDRLGIGTASPQDNIQVQGNGAGITVRSTSENIADAANIRLLENATAGIRLQYDGVGSGGNNGALVIKDNSTDTTIATFGRDGNVSINGVISGDGSGLTTLNASNLSSGTVSNSRLTNSGALTVTAGSGLTGGGSVALGGSTTINIGNDAVTDTHLAFNTGQHLTTSSSPTFAGLAITGKTFQLGNLHPEFNWTFGGGTDLDWKTIANVSLGTGAYKGAMFEVEVIDAACNYGCSSNAIPMKFYASMQRSGGTPDTPNNATVSGPSGDYVRVVKTALGEYELQVRQTTLYRHIQVRSQLISQIGATVSYAENPANGSTVGDIYMPVASHIDRFAKGQFWGELTALNGFTLSSGALSLPSNSVTDAMVSNTLTSSIFIGSGSSSNAVDLNTAEVAGTLPNARLVNSGALTVTAGSGLTGGGSVSLGGSTTINIGSDAVTDTHLQYNTGQHLTTSSSPTFAGLTLGTGGTTLSFAPYGDVTALNPGSTTAGTIMEGPVNAHVVVDIRNNDARDAFAIRYSNANNTTVDTVGLVFNANGRLGIGTTNPSQALDVVGNIVFSGTITGNGSGLSSLNASNLSSGTVSNARLTNSGSLTVTAGSGLTGGGAVALGGSTTINIGADAVTDAHLQFNTGQHLTTTSSPTFSAITANGLVTANSNAFNPLLIHRAGTTTNVAIGFTHNTSTTYYFGADVNSGYFGFVSSVTGISSSALKLYVDSGNITTSGTITGNGSGLTSLSGSNISSGTVANARLVNSGALTITAGSGLSGGGSVSLGGSTSLSIGSNAITDTHLQYDTGQHLTSTSTPTFNSLNLQNHKVSLGILMSSSTGAISTLSTPSPQTCLHATELFGITNLFWVPCPTISGTASSGQLAFFDSSSSQAGDSNLRWDNTNKRLGIGGAPADSLHVQGTASNRITIENTTSAGYAGIRTKTGSTEFFLGSNGDGDFTIGDNLAGMTRFSINESGNVGINVGTGQADALAVAATTSSRWAAQFYYGFNVATDDLGIIALNRQNSTVGDMAGIDFFMADTSGPNQGYGYIGAVVIDNTNGSEDGGLVFGAIANGGGYRAERMRLTGTGLGIGDTTPDFALDVVGTICQDTDGNGTCNGTVSSDERLKTNISTIDNALDIVAQLRGVTFEWRQDLYPSKHYGDGLQVGFIAQEVEQVLPELVFRDLDGYRALDYQKITAVLANAINQQQSQIDAIINRVNQLEQVAPPPPPTTASIDTTNISFGKVLADTITVNQTMTIQQNAIIKGSLQVGVGGISTTGGLFVAGPAEFQGPAIFKAMAEFIDTVIFRNNVQFAGKVAFNEDTVGMAVIPVGQSETTIEFTTPYSTQPIINVTLSSKQLTTQDFTQLVQDQVCQQNEGIRACQEIIDAQYLQANLQFIVTNTTTEGFTIKLAEPATNSLIFNWSALATINE